MPKPSFNTLPEKSPVSCRQYAWTPEMISLLRSLVSRRIDDLTGILTETDKNLVRAPEGKLRICNRKTKPQYYHRKLSSDRKGEYIPVAETGLAERLARKAYGEQVQSACLLELDALKKLDDIFHNPVVEELFDALPDHRKKLIEPIAESEDEFIRRWMDIVYQGLPFESNAPEFYTRSGLRVRSKSELIIAEWLNAQHIPFLYEFPIKLQKFGVVHPDFLLLSVRKRKAIVFEHLGMMDDPDYAARNIRKAFAYIMNGYLPGDNLIITAESKANPLNMQVTETLVRQCL